MAICICVMRRSFSSRLPEARFLFPRPTEYTRTRATDGGAMDFPQFELHGQIALVTGAARGLGRASSSENSVFSFLRHVRLLLWI